MSCPICKKPTAPDYRPFCSRRCADVDLARWFRADYVIPMPLTQEDDGSSDPLASDDQP